MPAKTRAAELVPITDVKCVLQYDLQSLPGALRYPFAAREVVICLECAVKFLHERSTPERRMELLIWDAYRTRETQQAIYEGYARTLAACKITYEEAYVKASSFVSPPHGIFPHGTGGAVDVTLLVNGIEAPMGTAFDAFIPEAASDWYRLHPPVTVSDREMACNREDLRAAMEHAGFVGLDNEWWHFEWGTVRWADGVNEAVVLNSIVSPPQVSGPTCCAPVPPSRQPVIHYGVAPVFTDPALRAAALLHEEPGHYYVRTSHPTIEALARCVQNILTPACRTCLTASGLAACITALKALMPRGGCIIYDKYVYYEVEREILALAQDFGWKTIRSDFLAMRDLKTAVMTSERVDVLFCDNPRNWWLESLDIPAVALVARSVGAKLIVDTSVQPVQDLLDVGVAVVACSLSKYPSLSLTAGGALMCNDLGIHDRLVAVMAREGNILSPEAAGTIWSQILSVRDRLTAISQKTDQIAGFLRSHPAVRKVRTPDVRRCGGILGGQLTFHLVRSELGRICEKIIGFNSLGEQCSLHLACTFGSAATTFEHFASNTRLRDGIPRELTNEVALPDDIVRLGIGCEDVRSIIGALAFVLDAAFSYYGENLATSDKSSS